MKKKLIIETAGKAYLESKNGDKEITVISRNGESTQRHFIVSENNDEIWDKVHSDKRFDVYNQYQFYLSKKNVTELQDSVDLKQMLPVMIADAFQPESEFAEAVNESVAPTKQGDSNFASRAAVLTAADRLEDALFDFVFNPLNSTDKDERRKGLIRSALLFQGGIEGVSTTLYFVGNRFQVNPEHDPIEEIKEAIFENNTTDVDLELPFNGMYHYAGFSVPEGEVFDD